MRMGAQVTFNKEARQRFVEFATSADAKWSGNFRDLNGAVVRMATLAAGGRISVELVEEEMSRLKRSWQSPTRATEDDTLRRLLGEERWDAIDFFDRIQLRGVIQVCREARSLSDAGRKLFNTSRSKKTTTNDADRLRNYLARFNLDWQEIVER
jgi:transcriptional regulatory protein RtcR